MSGYRYPAPCVGTEYACGSPPIYRSEKPQLLVIVSRDRGSRFGLLPGQQRGKRAGRVVLGGECFWFYTMNQPCRLRLSCHHTLSLQLSTQAL